MTVVAVRMVLQTIGLRLPPGMPPLGLGAGGGPGGVPGFGAMPGLGGGQGADMASLMQVLLPRFRHRACMWWCTRSQCVR